MKYDDNNQLPTGITENLPEDAQALYKNRYNEVFEKRQREKDAKQIAHRFAWSAVKSSFSKSESGSWRKKEK